MVTKQQQLEFAAKHIEKWKSGYDFAVIEKMNDGQLCVRWPSVCASGITKKEWQQERNRMQKQDNESECAVMTLNEAIDHANEKSRELKGHCAANHSLLAQWLTEYRDMLSKHNQQNEQDNSLSKCGSCPPIGVPVELWFGGSFAYNCEFICMRGRNYIVWNLDADRPDCADIMNSEFRPLRTEREKAIDELNALVGDIEKYPTWRDAIAGIIDAGYHKQ